MGIVDRIVGRTPALTALGGAVGGVAEVFVQNATRRMELDEEAHTRSVTQFGQEFRLPSESLFDRFINGLNRLPRPILALGTMGLFTYAMIEPVGFGFRMEGLQQVPEPLWWLLGAIVGFYFGAREAHYFRHRPRTIREQGALKRPAIGRDGGFPDNAALRDWVAGLRGQAAYRHTKN